MRRLKLYESPFIHNVGKEPHFIPARWTPGYFMADTGYSRKRTECELMEEFAVHRMIGTPGYTISYAPAGFRISSRDRVFRTSEWAKHVAEKLHPISNDWGLYADGDWVFPEVTVKLWNYIFDVAETKGAFRNELIAPGDRVNHAIRDW